MLTHCQSAAGYVRSLRLMIVQGHITCPRLICSNVASCVGSNGSLVSVRLGYRPWYGYCCGNSPITRRDCRSPTGYHIPLLLPVLIVQLAKPVIVCLGAQYSSCSQIQGASPVTAAPPGLGCSTDQHETVCECGTSSSMQRLAALPGNWDELT
jgi:hypothetical protein